MKCGVIVHIIINIIMLSMDSVRSLWYADTKARALLPEFPVVREKSRHHFQSLISRSDEIFEGHKMKGSDVVT